MMQRFLFLLFLFSVANSMLIYRPKQTRPKLVCYAVLPDAQKQQPNKVVDSSVSTTMLDPDQQVHMRILRPSTSNYLQSQLPTGRVKRTAKSFDEFNFDNGFDIDIVGASMSDENRDKIRKKLIQTCEALKSNPL